MKRSPIKSGAKSLERGSTFAADPKPLKRSGGPKRKPAPALAAVEVSLALRFHDEALRFSPRCENCGYAGPHVEAHHVIERRVMRALLRTRGREATVAALWDTRNAMTLCSDPAPKRCHDRHTDHSLRVPYSKLRAAHFEFARELDALMPGAPFSLRLELDYPAAA